MSTVTTTKTAKNDLSFIRIWLIIFVTLLIATIVLYGFANAAGWIDGWNAAWNDGEPDPFNWDRIGAAYEPLFAGGGALFAFIGVLAIVLGALWGVYELAKRNHPVWVVVVFVTAVIVGGYIIWRWIDWGSIGFNWLPTLIILGSLITASLISTTLIYFFGSKK